MSSTNFDVLNKSTEENSIVFEKSGKKNEAFFSKYNIFLQFSYWGLPNVM